MKLLLSTHNDDSELFVAFTILREKPHVIVVTDSWVQFNRGDDVTSDQRWAETIAASDILGYPALRLGLRDDTVTEEQIEEALRKYTDVPWDTVYAPALQNGNIHHDMVSRVADKLFGDKVVQYTTYTKTVLWTVGNKEVVPTQEEKELKVKAMMCHQSQMKINMPHFKIICNYTIW